MPSGSSILQSLGISEGDRVHMRNADPKVRSVIKWDLHDSCELVETNGDGFPYPPIDVSLLWVRDGDDLPAVFEAMRDRVPDDGSLWAVIRAKKHREEGRSAGIRDVAAAAKGAGLKDGEVVNLSDEDRAVRLLPSGGKSKSRGNGKGKKAKKAKKGGSSKKKASKKGGKSKSSKSSKASKPSKSKGKSKSKAKAKAKSGRSPEKGGKGKSSKKGGK